MWSGQPAHRRVGDRAGQWHAHAERQRSLHLHAGANYNGADSFTYRANDGTADSTLATVSFTVTAVNDAPLAVND